MKIYYYPKVFCLSFLLLFSSLVMAKSLDKPVSTSPYNVLKNTGNNLFSRIASSQPELKDNPSFMRTIVEEELMPSIDYRYAAYKILGKHLRKTTKEQRAHFVKMMRAHLVKTYATALKQYKTQQVVYESNKSTHGKKIVAVKTQIIDMNAPTINVVFKMHLNKKTGKWKAYDMVVEGISLLSTKQAEMGKMIASKGLDNAMSDPLCQTSCSL